jgi:hypothetical protein
LLALASIKYSDVKQRGGNFQIIMDWECETTESYCNPTISVQYLNFTNKFNPIGTDLSNYKERIISYKDAQNNTNRDYSMLVGLRFFLVSVGKGK